MQLSFLGAASTVTGSKYLLEVGNKQILIDCGLYQGVKNQRQRNWQAPPFNPKKLAAVLLTHAHIDHSGYIPALVKAGFRGPIYCTPGTKALCSILLPDAGHLQEEDARYASKKGFSKHSPALALYTEADALAAMDYFSALPFDEFSTIAAGIEAKFTPAGHILGASSISIKAEGKTLVFSGDLGRQTDPIMYPPHTMKTADYLVVESTYGNRHHDKSDPEETLARIVADTVARGGSVLIPSFAVGRAQALLHILAKLKTARRIPDVPIYLNSPMAISATKLLFSCNQQVRLSADDCQLIDDNVRYVRSVEESIEINEQTFPHIVISASGMASGGRVLHHMKTMLPNSRNSIIFAGFQAPGTRGASLVDGAEKVKIHGAYYEVKAAVFNLENLSAHADSDELIAWVSHFSPKPRQVFVTHGEPVAADSLRLRIKDELGINVCVPEYLDRVELS